jgi:hypothetical protein
MVRVPHLLPYTWPSSPPANLAQEALLVIQTDAFLLTVGTPGVLAALVLHFRGITGVGYSVSSTCWMARRISATVQGLVRHGTAL